MICPELQHRDASTLQVLLMLEVLIGNDEQIETFGFGAIEQIPITDALPAFLNGR
ncbi:MAG: hypothetical protein QOH88_1709 [Verrucomicrobiota bacterium]